MGMLKRIINTPSFGLNRWGWRVIISLIIRELGSIMAIIEKRKNEIEEKWHEHFNQS